MPSLSQERQEGQETEAAAEEIPETRQTAENGQEEIPGTWQAVPPYTLARNPALLSMFKFVVKMS